MCKAYAPLSAVHVHRGQPHQHEDEEEQFPDADENEQFEEQHNNNKSHVASCPPGFNVEHSAIIHVNTTQLGAPILMTPDAFVNSPNNQSNSMRKSLNSSDI